MQILTYACPNCGATLTFQPETQELGCNFCKFSSNIENFKEKYGDRNTAVPTKTAEKLSVYHCSRCGGDVVAEENTAATFCIYCGDTAIFPQKMTSEFQPRRIIGFSKTKEDATTKFLELCKTHSFVPKEFTIPQNVEKLSSLYVPFFLYSYRADGKLIGNATTSRSWSDSTYNYTETKHYTVRREGNAVFDNVPVDASKEMSNEFMDSLEPYGFEGLKDFDYAFLSGFYAQRPDETRETIEPRACNRVENTLTNALRNDIHGYSTVHITHSDINADLQNTELALLPVWMLNTQYKGKRYTFAMNGQTGKMVGRTPICIFKAMRAFALSFLVSFLILFLIALAIKPASTRVDLTKEQVMQNPRAAQWEPLDTNVKVYDYAQLIPDAQEAQLQQMAMRFIDKREMDVVVVTVTDTRGLTAWEYTEDFYDYSGFGLDEYGNGIILSINMDKRKVYIRTCASAIDNLTDAEIEKILDKITPMLTSGDYVGGVESFYKYATKYAGAPINTTVVYPLGGALLLSGLIIGFCMLRTNNAKSATESSAYLRNGVSFTQRSDVFLRSSVSKTKKATQNSGGGGGGGGSSSGRSSGGGGRSF